MSDRKIVVEHKIELGGLTWLMLCALIVVAMCGGIPGCVVNIGTTFNSADTPVVQSEETKK